MDDFNALKHHLEYLFLKKIIASIKENTITLAQAKEYSNAFLKIEPFISSEDAHAKIMQFVGMHPLFIDLKYHMDDRAKEKYDLEKINKMRIFLKQNNIEAALQVAKS